METLRIAAEALQRNKLRSFLTLLGVIIGVMTVIAVVSVISGLNNFVATQLFQLNPDVFVVTRFGIITSRDEFLEAVKRKLIDDADLAAVQRLCTGCQAVGADLNGEFGVRRGNERLNGVRVHGSSANMAELSNLDIEAGRFFTPAEELHGAPIAVIGSDVRQELFGQLDPIGRTFTVAGRPLRVIGLLKKQGSVMGQSQDSQLYMPLKTFRKSFGSRRSLDLFIRAEGGVPAVARVEDEVRVIFRSRRHTPYEAADPIGMVTGEAIQNAWQGISAGAFALVVLISGISLVVGGIVIMNIMLVSVVERTREIGIRRAIGAKRRDILGQFLAEAVMLSLVGGVVGVLLGWGISKGIAAAFPLPTLVRPSLIALGLGISVLTGALAGVMPARRASKLMPVEALRYE